MNIIDYLFYGKYIDKVPKELKVILCNEKQFFFKNLTGTDGEVRLFKNQKTFYFVLWKKLFENIRNNSYEFRKRAFTFNCNNPKSACKVDLSANSTCKIASSMVWKAICKITK